ncbi:hypothetical protein GOC69_22265 [Sinorhizobium medicae]|nr:hypothetical protein [Sinorhizobium medicae]MDX0474673.1 hypothetical protein [Sinorhizobium medicae]
MPAALAGLEGERQHARGDRHDAGQSAAGQFLADDETACCRDEKRCDATHQGIDEPDVASAIRSCDELKIGELEKGRYEDVRHGLGAGHWQERQKGQRHDGSAERHHGSVERFFRAGFDERVPGGVQERSEKYERNDVRRQNEPLRGEQAGKPVVGSHCPKCNRNCR